MKDGFNYQQVKKGFQGSGGLDLGLGAALGRLGASLAGFSLHYLILMECSC
jgi:hypothetical protein